jgi:diaminopimelate epimerase
MSRLPFAKFQGAGNDFVVLDGRPGAPAAGLDWDVLARRMCDRHYGIGADGILVADLPREQINRRAAVRMRMFNPDGSEAEMCGNGLRCFARWLLDARELSPGMAWIETGAGVLRVDISAEGKVAARMGRPQLAPSAIPLTSSVASDFPEAGPVLNLALDVASPAAPNAPLLATCVSMGNPHAVFFVDDVAKVPLARWGPAIEHHAAFPARTNAEFCQVLAPDRIRVRVWERGAGITLACGTGACAAMVAGRLHGRVAPRVTVELPGGELDITWSGDDEEVTLSGPAVRVFDGIWPQPNAEASC